MGEPSSFASDFNFWVLCTPLFLHLLPTLVNIQPGACYWFYWTRTTQANTPLPLARNYNIRELRFALSAADQSPNKHFLKLESMGVHGRWRFRKKHAVIKVEYMGVHERWGFKMEVGNARGGVHRSP